MAVRVLVTVGDLPLEIRQSIADSDAAAAQWACDRANAVVSNYCDPTLLDAATEEKLEAAKTVAARVAARVFRNPADRQVFSGPEGLAFTPATSGRILTDDEREQLARLTLPAFA